MAYITYSRRKGAPISAALGGTLGRSQQAAMASPTAPVVSAPDDEVMKDRRRAPRGCIRGWSGIGVAPRRRYRGLLSDAEDGPSATRNGTRITLSECQSMRSGSPASATDSLLTSRPVP